MSLINEALKKAQAERPESKSPPTESFIPPPPPQPPKRKRNHLWGFLMAIIVVGLFSAAVSMFLVWQILGTDEAEATPAATKQVSSTPKPAAAKPASLPEAVVATDPVATESGVEPPTEAIDSETTLPEPAQTSQTTAVATPEPDSMVVEAAPAPAAKPDPAVWARLQQFEIRGIMSGGTKVLIFDTSTGKSQSFQPGDIVDGNLNLKVATISLNAIVFQDYGGSLHTKSF